LYNPNWIAGFTSGDDWFNIMITKASTKIGKRVQLRFVIGLNIRDKEVLIGLIKYFKLNYENFKENKYIYYRENNNSVNLHIANFSQIINTIILFFEKYKILGI